MREILEDIREQQPLDPNEAARRGMRPRLRRRFYEQVTVVEGAGGFGLALDGRPVRTAAQRALAAPTASLAEALAAAAAIIPRNNGSASDIWRLGATHSVTTLTGSALIALALLSGKLSVADAWAAAHVDEDWNMAQWGRDELALERRAYREAEMHAAGRVLELLGRSS